MMHRPSASRRKCPSFRPRLSLAPSETNTGVWAVMVTVISPESRFSSHRSWRGTSSSRAYRRITLLGKETKL